MVMVASVLGDNRIQDPWEFPLEKSLPLFTSPQAESWPPQAESRPPRAEMDDPFDDFEDDDFDDEFDDDFEEDWEDDLTQDEEFPDTFGGGEKKEEKESPFKGDPDFDEK